MDALSEGLGAGIGAGVGIGVANALMARAQIVGQQPTWAPAIREAVRGRHSSLVRRPQRGCDAGAAETNVGAMQPPLQSFARIRARQAKTLAAVLTLGTAMVALAPHAYADDDNHIGPGVGSECWHYQLNTVTIGWAAPPVRVRCVAVPGAGLKWEPDIGPDNP